MEETQKKVEKEISEVVDIETYCDIKGIHEGERFAYLKLYKKGTKTVEDWAKFLLKK